MKKTFFSGLAILLPIAITFFVFFVVIRFFTNPFIGLMDHVLLSHGGQMARKYHQLFLILGRVFVLIFFVLFVFIIGVFARRLCFSRLLKWINCLFAKTPLIKTIYCTFQDIGKNVLTGEKGTFFKETVLVSFPSEKTYALGLISGDLPREIQVHVDQQIQNAHFQAVFVPTSPHPASGFLLMYSKYERKKVDIDTEDLFRFLISCGTIQMSRESNSGQLKCTE